MFEVESIGYEFYIILRGQVSILINIPNAYTEEERKRILNSMDMPVMKRLERYKSSYAGVVDAQQGTRSTVIQKHMGAYVLYKHALLKEVNRLGEGSSFGEAALTSQNSLRNATVLALADCYFAILNKNDYERIIGNQLQADNKKKFGIMKENPIFSHLKDHQIHNLIYYIDTVRFRYRDCIVREGGIIEYIYILVEGRVKMVKKKKGCRGGERKGEIDLLTVSLV